jgi:hypothetical protein
VGIAPRGHGARDFFSREDVRGRAFAHLRAAQAGQAAVRIARRARRMNGSDRVHAALKCWKAFCAKNFCARRSMISFCRASMTPALQRHAAFNAISSAEAASRMGKIRSRSNCMVAIPAGARDNAGAPKKFETFFGKCENDLCGIRHRAVTFPDDPPAQPRGRPARPIRRANTRDAPAGPRPKGRARACCVFLLRSRETASPSSTPGRETSA